MSAKSLILADIRKKEQKQRHHAREAEKLQREIDALKEALERL